MRIERVAKLTPEERFWYWVQERHKVYLRRKAGEPPPWTDDEILQNYFFTNPYRENDKTTVWFRETLRDRFKNKSEVIFMTVCFRWFNYIPTGELLREYGLLLNWNRDACRRDLVNEKKIFTGAFMINSPPAETKLDAITKRIDAVWRNRKGLIRRAEGWKTLRDAHADLTRYEGLGGFMAYEIVCDLRYTKWLEHATDKMAWANPGPGCIRGLYRIAGEEIRNKSNSTSPPKPKDWLERMVRLLKKSRGELKGLPRFEMREIEHSLCEFDKYERLRTGDGKAKRRFKGV